MFKTKKEFILALTEGRRFKLPHGVICYYDDEWGIPFLCKPDRKGYTRSMDDYEFDAYKEAEEVE